MAKNSFDARHSRNCLTRNYSGVIFADNFFQRERQGGKLSSWNLGAGAQVRRYLDFSLKAGVEPRKALIDLVQIADGKSVVVGIGQPTVLALGKTLANLRPFPTHFGAGLVLPSTSSALRCWLRGHDRGDLLHASNKIVEAVSSAFSLDGVIDAFNHGGGKDLTGYEDGTENPHGQKAIEVAIARGQGDGLDRVSSLCSSGCTILKRSRQCRAKIRITPSDGEKATTKS